MPDNAAYLYLGMVVVVGLVILYVISLVLRFRNAQKDIALVESMNE